MFLLLFVGIINKVVAAAPPVDGQYGPWSSFGACSATCDGGVQYRTRKCNQPPPSDGGRYCQGPAFEMKPCQTQPCPVDGGFREWSTFSLCSVSCGVGVKHRTRACTNPAPAHGGKWCEGLNYDHQLCHEKCDVVDGKFGQWSTFSPCSNLCGGGVTSRTRVCDNPLPANGGKVCVGASVETMACNTQTCIIDGAFGKWSNFTACSKSCAGGVMKRSRKCDNPPPSTGAKNCTGEFTQSVKCNQFPCPVDGRYGQWSGWSDCTKVNRECQRQRTRTCTEPKFGGRKCGDWTTHWQLCEKSSFGKCYLKGNRR